MSLEHPLSDSFLAAAQADPLALADAETLERVLADLCATVAAPAAALGLGPEQIAQALGRHHPVGLQGPEELRRLHVLDLCLLWALHRGVPSAARRFEELKTEVRRLLLRRHVAAATVEDILQSLSAEVLGWRDGRGGYSGRGPLVGWLTVAALRDARKAEDRRAREHRTRERDPELLAEIGAGDVDLLLLRRRHRGDFLESLREAVAQMSPRERTLLRWMDAEGLDADQVAALLGVHRATVLRWLQRARHRLRERLRHGLARRLRLSYSECLSLLRGVRSDVESQVRRALLTEPGSS